MRLRNIAVLGGIGVAALALIGVGAAATFTQTTVSNQQIQAGTLDVTLSTTLGGATLSNNGQTLTLAQFGPTQSSFTTGDQLITITNSGDITVNEITEQLGATGASALINELSVCEVSSGTVIYNGLLKDGLSLQSIAGTIAPAGTDSYTINVYAGSETTACGTVTTVGSTAVLGTSSGPSLDNSVMGLTANVSVTVGYSG